MIMGSAFGEIFLFIVVGIIFGYFFNLRVLGIITAAVCAVLLYGWITAREIEVLVVMVYTILSAYSLAAMWFTAAIVRWDTTKKLLLTVKSMFLR